MIRFYERVEKAKPPRRTPKRVGTALYSKTKSLSTFMANAVRLDLLRGIETFRSKVSTTDLARAWAGGDYAKIQTFIPWDEFPDDLGPTVSQLRAAAGSAAKFQIEELPRNINANLRFDPSNPRLSHYLQTRTGRLITNMQGDTLKVVQNAVEQSFKTAMTPRDVANSIKNSIGLLPAHQVALEKYRQGLIAEKMTPDRVESLANAYSERLLDYRAMSIARTETRTAVVQGQLSVWREGASQGYIDPNKTVKTWFTADAPCPLCEPLNGVSVPLDDDFDTDDGPIDGPPYHVNCFCGLNIGISSEDEG